MTASRVKYVSLVHELAAWNDEGVSRSSDLLVLLALATFADRSSGAATVSLPRLAERTRMDVKTVRAALERLGEIGRLRVEERRGQPHRILLVTPPTPTGSGGTDSGTPTDSGTTDFGANPSHNREWTPTNSGNRTKGSSTKREAAPLALVPPFPVENAPATCPRHPHGTDQPCRRCQEVRLATSSAPASVEPRVRGPERCVALIRRGRHEMIPGDPFCAGCGFDPETGDHRDANDRITRAKASA